MPAYLGNNLFVSWTSTAGTVTPNTDYLKFDYTPSIEVVDQTAGADLAVTSIVGVKSGKASMTFNQQAGGTAQLNAFLEGTFGTLVVGPEGTVAGKHKMTFAAYVLGAKISIGYKDITVVSIDWTQDGARTDGVF